MSEIPLTTPRKELPPQGREEWDALREVRVSPEEAKIISKVAEYILRRASDAGMEKADFFKNPAFKGLTEKQISSALEIAATPVFEVGDRVYWLGPSEIEDIKLTDV